MTTLEYNRLYNNNQIQTWDADSPRNDWDLLADWLPRNLPAQSKVLDFGCYTGGLLEKLGSRYQRFGIEVNARARSVAAARTGAVVFPGLEGVPGSMKFDAILAVDVIEHFEAPGKVMAFLLDMLEDDGVLLISTGDGESWLWNLFGARWWYCFFPEHLAFISERWARQSLQMTGGSVQLESVNRFRHVHLSGLRYINQVILAFIYFLMPRAYLGFVPRLKRLVGRSAVVHPPGAGLTRDHIFLVIRKSGRPA